MKTAKLVSIFLITSVLALALSACSGSGSKQQQDGETVESSDNNAKAGKIGNAERKIPFKHGSYVQLTKAMGMEIKNTVYFDKWGEWTATENKSEMQIAGMTIKTDKIEIVKGNTHWDIDLIEKTGTQYEGLTLPTGVAAALGAALGSEMMEGMEIEELGTENYLGYPCKKTHVKYKDMQMEVTTLTYGNLTMKTEGKMGGMEIYNAIIEISESAPSASIFEVPAGIVIEKL